MRSSQPNPPIKTLGTRVAYQNRWMRVREDKIRLADRSESVFGVVEKSDFAVIAPLDEHGNLYLVEQYRYPIGRRFKEFPQGAWEAAPEASPCDLAHGELKEETGLTAGCMTHVGSMFQAYGYSSQKGHVFLATDLTQGQPEREPSEQDMTCSAYPVNVVEAMIRGGEIMDATTIAAFGMIRMHGRF